MEDKWCARAGGGGGAPCPDPLRLQGSCDGDPQWANGGGVGGGGGPEVPQHFPLKNDPRDALIIFEVCIMGGFFFLKKMLPVRFAAQVMGHH